MAFYGRARYRRGARRRPRRLPVRMRMAARRRAAARRRSGPRARAHRGKMLRVARVRRDYRLYRRVGGEVKYAIVKAETPGPVWAHDITNTGYGVSSYGRLSLVGGTGAGIFNPLVEGGEGDTAGGDFSGRSIKLMGIKFELDYTWDNLIVPGTASNEWHPKFKIMFSTPTDAAKFSTDVNSWPYEWLDRERYGGTTETLNDVPWTENDKIKKCRGLRIHKIKKFRLRQPGETLDVANNFRLAQVEQRSRMWIPIARKIEIKAATISAATGRAPQDMAVPYNQDIWYHMVGMVRMPATYPIAWECVPKVSWRATWIYMDA